MSEILVSERPRETTGRLLCLSAQEDVTVLDGTGAT